MRDPISPRPTSVHPPAPPSPLSALLLVALLIAAGPAGGGQEGPQPPSVAGGSDAEALAVVEDLLDRLGGLDAWRSQRHLAWRAFGRRTHFWHVPTGDLRIEGKDVLVLMNLHRREGRVWMEGREITDPEKLDDMLWVGTHWWQNDGYWLFMPYKLLDPGVRLGALGERTLDDGRVARILDVTFDEVGMSPENRFHVWIGKESRLVERWDFYKRRDDDEPLFSRPWEGWRECGELTLPSGPGDLPPWPVALWDDLPGGLYHDPERPPLPPARAGCDWKAIVGGAP